MEVIANDQPNNILQDYKLTFAVNDVELRQIVLFMTYPYNICIFYELFSLCVA